MDENKTKTGNDRTREVREMLDGAASVLGDELAEKLRAAYQG